MPAARVGVSGLALGVTAGGMLLVYAGVANATVSDTIRALLRGERPPSRPSTLEAARGDVGRSLGAAVARAANQATGVVDAGIGVAGTGSQPAGTRGQQIAAFAASYLGVPYVFGGADPSKGVDCSGLVTWVLHHDMGINLPSNSHTVTGQFLVWSGAVTVPRPPAAGDLICWPSHIGIAIDSTTMVHAPGTGQRVKTTNIWWTPAPIVRRVKG